MRLIDLPLRQPAYVDVIDWDALSLSDGQRLREFGLCEGASVEALHHGGLLGRGPIACKVGRMTIAMRRNHAAAITVRTGPEDVAA
ncbi:MULTISPECIES: FeoA family protein [Sphingobium]|uniref:FeoA family protein n=1 Tax=Sphingobium sp. MI1205 TaxID=407020 RepID=UPI00077034CA|nr:FeoA family protein [Sphingobium sp. MI1205]AMK16538.1 Fe2+ transport system protein A [Sphingobium sp. MI1205]